VSWDSKEWANSQLKFAISELRDASKKSAFAWKNIMHEVLIIKEQLQDHGWTWQAKTIDFWIHRYQRARRLSA